MPGYCYAMISGQTVKIGWSSAPALRVSKVRSDTPADVRLVGFVESTVEQEREIHGLLAPFRVFGEWFRLEGAVVAFVDALRGRGIKAASRRSESAEKGANLLNYMKQCRLVRRPNLRWKRAEANRCKV